MLSSSCVFEATFGKLQANTAFPLSVGPYLNKLSDCFCCLVGFKNQVQFYLLVAGSVDK